MTPGDKVLCIDDSNIDPSWVRFLSDTPKLGRVYVIRSVIACCVPGRGIALVGIEALCPGACLHCHAIGDPCWKPRRFRLLNEVRKSADLMAAASKD